METKKIKRFIFAPASESLKAALSSQGNNVRKSQYMSTYMSEAYLRIRIRNHSNTSQGICGAFVHRVSPIVYYKLHEFGKGDDKCSTVVATMRVERQAFESVVAQVAAALPEIKKNAGVYLHVHVSDILARDERPWVEVFCVKNRRLEQEKWQAQVEKLAAGLGVKFELWDAEVREFK